MKENEQITIKNCIEKIEKEEQDYLDNHLKFDYTIEMLKRVLDEYKRKAKRELNKYNVCLGEGGEIINNNPYIVKRFYVYLLIDDIQNHFWMTNLKINQYCHKNKKRYKHNRYKKLVKKIEKKLKRDISKIIIIENTK